MASSKSTSKSHLNQFRLERVLNDDAHALALLGTLPGEVGDGSTASDASDSTRVAIIRIESAPLTSDVVSRRFPGDLLAHVKQLEQNDIYSWYLGWLGVDESLAHVKINVVCPATEAHVRKYTKQTIVMVHETPGLYKSVVEPYIATFPPKRTQWVEDILSGASEADKVLHNDPDPSTGFVLIPDMKWDLTTVSSLYLMALARSPELRSLRDLRGSHLGLLCAIRDESRKVARQKWAMEEGGLRMFVHYQPSYYRFHVHIVNANYIGWMGCTVGQAHLLDDIISLLELEPETGPSIMERRTFTYGIGTKHGLYPGLSAATASSAV